MRKEKENLFRFFFVFRSDSFSTLLIRTTGNKNVLIKQHWLTQNSRSCLFLLVSDTQQKYPSNMPAGPLSHSLFALGGPAGGAAATELHCCV